MYDGAIGRWMCTDPKTEKYNSFSPYNYCVNNPIIFVDPAGKYIKFAKNMPKKGKNKLLFTMVINYIFSSKARKDLNKLIFSKKMHRINLTDSPLGSHIITNSLKNGRLKDLEFLLEN